MNSEKKLFVKSTKNIAYCISLRQLFPINLSLYEKKSDKNHATRDSAKSDIMEGGVETFVMSTIQGAVCRTH